MQGQDQANQRNLSWMTASILNLLVPPPFPQGNLAEKVGGWDHACS